MSPFVKRITYSAICIGLATVLSYVKLFSLPTGGSVTACSMLFISLVGFWFGPVAGLVAGATHGLLQLVLDPYVVHPVQFLLDYPLAFGAIGLSGFFWKHKYGLYTGYVAGALGRVFFSCLSGVIFFASYAPEGMNALWYSLTYNLSYIVPEVVITLILISIPAFRQAIYRVKNMV